MPPAMIFPRSVVPFGSIPAGFGFAWLFLMWSSYSVTPRLVHIIQLHRRVLQLPYTMSRSMPDSFAADCRASTPLTRPPFENLPLFGLNAELCTASTKSSLKFRVDHLRLSAITTTHPVVPNFHSVLKSSTFITCNWSVFITTQKMCGEWMTEWIARWETKTMALIRLGHFHTASSTGTSRPPIYAFPGPETNIGGRGGR